MFVENSSVGSFELDLRKAVEAENVPLVTKYCDVHAALVNRVPDVKFCDEKLIKLARSLIQEKTNGSRRGSRKSDHVDEITVCVPVKKGKGVKKAKSDVVDGGIVADDNEWVCALCSQLASADGSDLLLCDGECLRSFHTGCLGLTTVPEGDWRCEQCANNSHSCFVCNEQNSRAKVRQLL